MKVSIFGSGYVGLVQAAALAGVGNEVVCVDIDQNRVNDLNNGEVPIYEPGLTALVTENLRAGRLRFTANPKEAVEHAKVQFIAVGTPAAADGSADLQYVYAVAESIAQFMQAPKIIVNKSTVPVGTADAVTARVKAVLTLRGVDIAFDVASNPEFLKGGAAVSDFQKPDRIIIGTESADVERAMRELYAPFNRHHDRLMVMSTRSAELTKYAANAMLATKISFMNEIANIAERVGADIEEIRHGIGSDPRIDFSFIYPGCGYGGSCFPKDVNALANTAEKHGYTAQILRSVEAVNQAQKTLLFDHLYAYFEGDLKGKTIALWGLSFKPNTDDMRDAPSRVLMEALWAHGAKVNAFDPVAMEEVQRIYGNRPDLGLMGTKEAALRGADALVLVTEWNVFKSPDFDLVRETLNFPVIVDGRNQYEPGLVESYGIAYYGIGRGRSVRAL